MDNTPKTFSGKKLMVDYVNNCLFVRIPKKKTTKRRPSWYYEIVKKNIEKTSEEYKREQREKLRKEMCVNFSKKVDLI